MFIDLAAGTVPQWGTFLGILIGLIGLATVFVKGIPERTKAISEAKQADNSDYAKQIKDLIDQVHDLRNELQENRNDLRATRREVDEVNKRLTQSESSSRQRADRITNMTFIIRLLISELRRIDPNSIIVQQAEALLEQMDIGEKSTVAAADVADRAVEKAQDTVVAAKATVAELIHDRDEK